MSMSRLTIMVLLVTATISAQAQWWKTVTTDDVLLTQVGGGAHLAMTMNGNNFTLPYAPTCCGSYSTATSFGPSLSGLFNQEITKWLRLSARLTYAPYRATFEEEETILFMNSDEGTVLHTLETSYGTMGLEALLQVRIFRGLRLNLGGSAANAFSGSYSQKETLLDPIYGTFENGLRVRNQTTDADLQDLVSPQFNVIGGLSYDLPLTSNHSVVLSPEVFYTVGLSEVVSGTTWKTQQFRVGATVAFALNAPKPPIPVERVRVMHVDSVLASLPPDGTYRRVEGGERFELDTLVGSDTVTITEHVYRTDSVYTPVLPVIDARIAARAIDEKGAPLANFTIGVSTQFITEALPLLPVVFFESHSSFVSSRYRQLVSATDFDLNAISPRTTAVHRDVLNIIGQRLQEETATTIRLRGTADPTTEGGNCTLAQQRADAVKKYLVDIWKISPDRITVVEGTGTCAPPRTTREQSEEGYSENRRVEIETDNVSLLAAVAKRRFNEARTVSPSTLVLDPSGSSSDYVTSWSLEARSGGTVVFSQVGKGTPRLISQPLTPATADLMRSDIPLDVTLKLDGLRDVHAAASTALKVVRDTMSTELERLTLMLFEISSDEITPVAEEQVHQFVKNVPAGSTVIVRGYADLLGNAEFNRKLSRKRADAVCASIRKHLTKRIDLQCSDIATDTYPPGIDSYGTPEERFLSRTVQIEVKRSR